MMHWSGYIVTYKQMLFCKLLNDLKVKNKGAKINIDLKQLKKSWNIYKEGVLNERISIKTGKRTLYKAKCISATDGNRARAISKQQKLGQRICKMLKNI